MAARITCRHDLAKFDYDPVALERSQERRWNAGEKNTLMHLIDLLFPIKINPFVHILILESVRVIAFQTKLQHVIHLYHEFGVRAWVRLAAYPDPELYHHILIGTLTSIESDKLRHQLFRTEHHRDSRKIMEYAREMILNWLIEDLVIQYVLPHKFKKIKLIGGDRDRRFLTGSHVAATPDLKADGRKYDIKCDWTGYWHEKGIVDLRDGEYPLLLKQNAGLVLILPFQKQIGILDSLTEVKVIKGKMHPIWHKPYHALELSENLCWEDWK